jgi:hypothetical protein
MASAVIDAGWEDEEEDAGFGPFTDWFFDEAAIPLLTAALGLSLSYVALLSLYGCARVLMALYGLLSGA